MSVISIMRRGGEDYHEYKKALARAKKSIETLYELTEDMEDEYGDYSERRMMRRGHEDEYSERGGMR